MSAELGPPYLQVGGEGVREPHVAWEGTEDEVAELDAVGWDDVTEAVMVITQELWEVVQQDQEDSQCALNHRKDVRSELRQMIKSVSKLISMPATPQTLSY